MSELKDILLSVTLLSVTAGIISFLFPEGKEGGMKRQAELLIAVAILTCISAPIIRLISSAELNIDLTIPQTPSTELTGVKAGIVDSAKQIISSELEKAVEKRFGIEEPRLVLTLDCSDISNIEISSGVLYGRGRLHEAAEYISGILMCRISAGEGET